MLVLALTACLSTPSRPSGSASDAGADAPGACAMFGPWKAPHQLDVGTNLDDETGAWLSPDGLDLWYAATLNSPHIHHAHRTDTSTYVFAQQAQPDVGWDYADPFLSYDQLEMWHEEFTDTRAIWHATRAAPDIAFNDVSEVFHDAMQYAGPSVTADKKTMVLCVSGGGIADDTRRLYVATRGAADVPWGTPTVIAELDGTETDFAPSISADGKTLVWTRGIPGDEHIMMATLNMSGLWANAARLDAVGTGFIYGYPFLSQDGRTLVYSEDSNNGNLYDLYMIERDCL